MRPFALGKYVRRKRQTPCLPVRSLTECDSDVPECPVESLHSGSGPRESRQLGFGMESISRRLLGSIPMSHPKHPNRDLSAIELVSVVSKRTRPVLPDKFCLPSVIFTTKHRILPSGNDLQHPEGREGAEVSSRHSDQLEETWWENVADRVDPRVGGGGDTGSEGTDKTRPSCQKHWRARSPSTSSGGWSQTPEPNASVPANLALMASKST